MIETFEPAVVRDFAIALLIGALAGIEREKHQTLDGEAGPGGLRTFILFAMTGAVAVAVFLLGGAVILGHPAIAVALAIVTSATLAFKRPLHGIVDRLGTEDIYAGLKLLIATFIVLPLLPDAAVDPWGALNPHRLWLLVILISTLSLVGYVAVRGFGPAKGMVLTGLAGGLVYAIAGLAGLTDVDAITLSMAEQARRTADLGPPVRAIVIASITNTVAKCAFVIVLGSPRLRRRVAAATATILAGGIVSLFALVPR